MVLSLGDRICHGQQFHDHVTEDPDFRSVSEGDIVGLKAASVARNATWRTMIYSPTLFLLGACERMKRTKGGIKIIIKKNEREKAERDVEKSLKVLSSKSCNFWVRVGSSFTVTGHEMLCALCASAVHPAAQGLC